MANESPLYLKRVRQLPCANCGRPAPNEAHHRTGAGMARRAHDHDAMPLCRRCHHDLHALAGSFKTFDRAMLRSWQDDKAHATRERLLRADNDNGSDVF
jgi:hypothetical protein